VLIILTTHPIQYQVPLWQALAKDGRVPFEVWYLTDHGTRKTRDREFGNEFAWDIDTLAGYPHRFLDVAYGATPSSFIKCRLRERLRDRLRESGAKALWIQGWQVAAYWQAVREAKAAGVPVWLRGESNDLAPVTRWKRPLKRVQLGWLFSRVDHFFYIGTANKRLYLRHGVAESQLHPAPYAVDNERFARQADAVRSLRTEIRKQWNIPEDAFCILFCGKFIEKKRPMDLISAARLLSTASCKLQAPSSAPLKLHLLFVGSGELGAELRAACHVVYDAENPSSVLRPPTSETRPSASFAGFLNQTKISKAYVTADCLVLPSNYGETWGLVVNEALASGLPCIISEACGCAEDLGIIPGCAIFPVGQAVALATRIYEKAKSIKLGELQNQSDIRDYSVHNTVTSIVESYRNRLNKF
jgi:glycosyltransferase involved in cell wall biosynthesis